MVTGVVCGFIVVTFCVGDSSSFWPSTSLINVFGAQHFVPDFLHLKTSVISAFPVKESTIKMVLTI